MKKLAHNRVWIFMPFSGKKLRNSQSGNKLFKIKFTLTSFAHPLMKVIPFLAFSVIKRLSRIYGAMMSSLHINSNLFPHLLSHVLLFSLRKNTYNRIKNTYNHARYVFWLTHIHTLNNIDAWKSNHIYSSTSIAEHSSSVSIWLFGGVWSFRRVEHTDTMVCTLANTEMWRKILRLRR